MVAVEDTVHLNGQMGEEKRDRAAGQSEFNSASWKQHNVPHLRHDPFSAPGGEKGRWGESNDTGTIAKE